MRRGNRLLGPVVLTGLAALLAAAAPAAATSFVMVSDAALADQAAVIAEGAIASVGPSASAGTPSTDYGLIVDRLLKGRTAGRSIVVRVPGGVRDDGLIAKVWGAPSFAAGDRVLFFLAPRTDGSYGILHLMLGAFRETAAGGEGIAVRDLGDADEVRIAPDGARIASPGADRPRDRERFVAWLADRAGGTVRAPDYFADLAPDALESLRSGYTLFEVNGLNLRRFEFDNGGSVTFFAGPTGQEGLAGGGYAELAGALAAWSGAAGTRIHYVYGGTTGASGGLGAPDGVNAVLFNDPNHDLANIANSVFSCSQGGLLAYTFAWASTQQAGVFKGRTYARIYESDMVTNSGIACFFEGDPCASADAEELLTHELGHSLGLNHSCDDPASGSCLDPVKNDAIMRAFVHSDCRGGRLGADDLAAVRALYAPAAATACRTTANALCLGGHYQATLRWFNQFDGTSGVGRAVSKSAATGFFSFGDPANIELLVKLLDFGDVIKVFYGELTDLQFTLTVTDTRNGDARTYSNTTGDCGGIDQAAFAGSTVGARSSSVRPSAAGACRPDAGTLCLLDGRFAVTVDWSNPGAGTSGHGGAARLSNLVGTFFFTDRGNVELMTKLVPFPDRVAFFYGALSDLPYTIRITDTATGTVRTYRSAAGKLCGGLDDQAF